MKTSTETITREMQRLAEDARALMAATADVADGKVGEARKRLASALENGEALFGRARDQAVEGARIADQAVRENPYQAVGIALGIGAILGCLLTHRCCRNNS